MTGEIPRDPDIFHKRLHQTDAECIRQFKTSSTVTKENTTEPKQLYFTENENQDDDTVDERNVVYNVRGQLYFRRRIIRGSSSFSAPDYKGRTPPFRRVQPNRGLRGTHHRTQLQVIFAPTKLHERSGNFTHCFFCNSWFHLFRDRPELERTGMQYKDEPHF